MIKLVVEEVSALVSLCLFCGMIAVWAALLS